MASTKTDTSIWSSQTLTAGAGDSTSSAVNLTDGYGASLNIMLTNGATGPTVAAQVEINVSNDGTNYYELTTVQGATSNSAVSEWGGIDIAMPIQYVKLIAGSNTGQNVTVDADISEVTAI